MSKKIFIYIFFIILILPLYSIEIQKYNFEFIKTIPIGNEEGMIGYNEIGNYAGGATGPLIIAINKDMNLYIPDIVNKRINIYNFNIKYLSTIYTKSKCYGTSTLKFDNGNNLIFLVPGYGLGKIDQKGNKIFFIDRKELPHQVMGSQNFFPIEEYTFFYDDNFYVQYITPDGKIEGNARAIQLLDDISVKRNLKAKSEDDTISKLSIDRKQIILGDMFFSSKIQQTEMYFYERKIKRDFPENPNARNPDGIRKEFPNMKKSPRFLNYDTDHNSYWLMYIEDKDIKKMNEVIFIYSKTGVIVDIFYSIDLYDKNGNISRSRTAVAPNGDVYIMKFGEGYDFYRLKRKW